MLTDMLFSIVIPSYNRAGFIGRTVQSVIHQSYTNWELIIIDDGSTDNTEEVVKAIDDPRIRYFKVENGERGRARNIGSHNSSGDYIYFLDSDDILYPEHLFTAYEHLKEKQPELLWLPYEQVNKEGKVLRPYRPLRTSVIDTLINEGNFMSCHGVFLRKDIARGFSFNENRELAGSEDMELWLRLASRYPFVIGSKVTSALVEHDERSVMNFNDIHKLIKRKELMLSYLLEDSTVVQKVGNRIGRLRSSAYSYIALHAMMNKNTSSPLAWKYLWKSFLVSPTSILSKRSLAIIKYGIKRTFS